MKGLPNNGAQAFQRYEKPVSVLLLTVTEVNMLTAIRKNGLTLAIFACATTGLVAFTQYLTKDQIKILRRYGKLMT